MVEVMTSAALRVAAEQARADARQARARSSERRIEVRRALALAAVRQSQAAASLTTLTRTRQQPFRSVWSDLAWEFPGRELDRVLVPHDGDT